MNDTSGETRRHLNPRVSIRYKLRGAADEIRTIRPRSRLNVRFPDFRGNLPQFVAHARAKCKTHVGRIMQTRALATL